MEIQASYVLQFFAVWCTSQKSFHFSLCKTASVLIYRNAWCFTWNIWESLLRLFPFLNADKHSPLQVRGALSGGWADASVSGSWKLPLIQTSPNPLLIALRNWSRRLAWFESSGYSQSASLLAHNRMLLRSLSGVACTTPDTSKPQPTAYCFEQLKQATCLIRLKCIFMHEHNQTGMPN